MIQKKDKRGVEGIIFFFVALFIILIIGFIAAMATGIIGYTGDIITPITNDLGVVNGANLSQASVNSVGVVNGFVQALPWLLGFAYVAALIFSVIFVLSYSYNPNPIFIGLYMIFIILLIFGSVIISNMYEDIYSGTDDIALRLQAQPMLSYLILYSPAILTLIAFIAGIFLFAGRQNELGGSFGV